MLQFKLGQEVEKIAMEYTDEQNRVQEVYNELSKPNTYSNNRKTMGETYRVYQHVAGMEYNTAGCNE